MFRFNWVHAGLAVLLVGGACSDDDSGAGAGGSAGSANDAGSAGSAGAGGSSIAGNSGSAGAGGGSGASGAGATYSVQEACERFAAVTCDKGVECGLVLDMIGNALICLQCTPTALTIIEQACAGDLDGPKSAAEVDSCLESAAAEPCADVCANTDPTGCEVFSELQGDGGDIICDAQCID
jgi:hypothetical protein